MEFTNTKKDGSRFESRGEVMRRYAETSRQYQPDPDAVPVDPDQWLREQCEAAIIRESGEAGLKEFYDRYGTPDAPKDPPGKPILWGRPGDDVESTRSGGSR